MRGITRIAICVMISAGMLTGCGRSDAPGASDTSPVTASSANSSVSDTIPASSVMTTGGEVPPGAHGVVISTPARVPSVSTSPETSMSEPEVVDSEPADETERFEDGDPEISESSTSSVSSAMPDLSSSQQTSQYPNPSGKPDTPSSSSIHSSSSNPAQSPAGHYGEVCVATSGNGNRYHTSGTCSGMNNHVEWMTIEEARRRGFTNCRKCAGGM